MTTLALPGCLESGVSVIRGVRGCSCLSLPPASVGVQWSVLLAVYQEWRKSASKNGAC
jgi:hypothetical protein